MHQSRVNELTRARYSLKIALRRIVDIRDNKNTFYSQFSPMASHLLPQGAYDTHVHVFDKQLGPYHPSRSYTPGEAPVQDLLDFESCISLTGKPSNIVIVQASPYRNDNRVVLAALQKLRDAGVESARGIAVFDPATITDDELDEMHRLGVRGLRLNVQADGGRPNLEAFQNALISSAERIKGLPNWKLQVYAPAEIWDGEFQLWLQRPTAHLVGRPSLTSFSSV